MNRILSKPGCGGRVGRNEHLHIPLYCRLDSKLIVYHKLTYEREDLASKEVNLLIRCLSSSYYQIVTKMGEMCRWCQLIFWFLA